MKRFGSMEEASQIGITSEELELKRKARMERFGAAEVQEAQKAQKEEQNGGGFKMNRRRNKMLRKNFQKEGKRTIVL